MESRLHYLVAQLLVKVEAFCAEPGMLEDQPAEHKYDQIQATPLGTEGGTVQNHIDMVLGVFDEFKEYADPQDTRKFH